MLNGRRHNAQGHLEQRPPLRTFRRHGTGRQQGIICMRRCKRRYKTRAGSCPTHQTLWGLQRSGARPAMTRRPGPKSWNSMVLAGQWPGLASCFPQRNAIRGDGGCAWAWCWHGAAALPCFPFPGTSRRFRSFLQLAGGAWPPAALYLAWLLFIAIGRPPTRLLPSFVCLHPSSN